MAGISIRPLHTLEEFDRVVALQRQEWDDPTTVIYQHMLISIVRNGGLLLGAIKDGQVIGFVLGYLGTDAQDGSRPAMANLKLVSQRMTVLPEYRGTGLGYALKMAQREHAIRQGIRLITWTFDPMNSRNAHLNIRKLGSVVEHYERDYYGTQPSPLISLGQSDRLVATWRITTTRVEQRIAGDRQPLGLEQYLSAETPILNPSRARADGLPEPGSLYPARGMLALIETPTSFSAVLRADVELARAWRVHGREVFTQAFNSGFFITDFVHATFEGRERSFYVFSSEVINAGNFSPN